ncbi:MAG: zinc-dependent peptidase [Flavobacteriales bacterium]|nr:zinc-dependent peptidase [Flavobacteriales bacterium]
MERITAAFMHEKDWVGAGITVAEEMKVMIAPAPRSCSWASRTWCCGTSSASSCIRTPTDRRRAAACTKGGASPDRASSSSAGEDFVHGYAHSRDAHNVGLHELAHALWFEDMTENSEHNFLDRRLLSLWNRMASEHVARIKRQEPHFFRDYAGTNQAEFFAVAVEYFFELPLDFRKAEPEFYATLSAMLKRDPAVAPP